MAITINQSPTTPNMANNTLLFAVSSNSSSAAQFQYIANVSLSGSSTVLQTIKQQPNPNSYGVFDFGQIVSNYLDSDNSWKAASFVTSSEVAKRFTFKFGEEYGSSISGSAIQYTGVGSATGSAAVTASAYTYIANGLVDVNDKVNWNFPSASFFTPTTVSTAGTFDLQNTLSNAPLTQYIQDGEYATISLFNGNFNNSATAAQDIFAVRVRSYNSSNTLLDDIDLTNLISNGGGPRANGTQVWTNVTASQTAATQLLTIGVGPQNLNDAGDPLLSTWSYYIVNVVGQLSAGVINYSGSYATLRYEKQEPNCDYDGVRFAWKNEFGVWDYFNFTLQTNKSVSIERQQFTQPFVNFSSANPTVSYDTQRRGIKQFYNGLTSKLTVNSDWLNQADADWLKELFFSTNVYQQVGLNFYPIAITSAEVVEKTNPRTQKRFQYVVEFQPANELNPRL